MLARFALVARVVRDLDALGRNLSPAGKPLLARWDQVGAILTVLVLFQDPFCLKLP